MAILTLGAGLQFSHAATEPTPMPASLTLPVVSEQFNDLAKWRPLAFPLANDSQYNLTPEGYLRADSDSSVSALILEERFRPAEYPYLSWRWNIENVHPNGDAMRQEGDDFAMRVSVCFKFDPKKVSDNERRWFKMEKLVWGEYPPYRVLHYVFANRSDLDQRYLDCPYSDRARLVIQRAGAENQGQWFEEQVNIMDDYRAAFGEEPPEEAVISVMADGDNTEGRSTAYIDWIKISGPDPS
ncbi:MAG: DUF3047 domain-containing protein [Puniceicoccales bacterium]